MFIKNNKRFNLIALLDGVFIDDAGIQHPGSLLRNPEFREAHGISEIAEPARGDYETQDTQEIDVAPWVIITDKSQEQLNNAFNAKVKAEILVKEQSQDRAIREAILAGDLTKLQAIEAEIVALRATLR
jgi:hypothetical protein